MAQESAEQLETACTQFQDDVFHLGLLVHYVLSGHECDGDSIRDATSKADLRARLPHADDMEKRFPGSIDLLSHCVLDRMAITEMLKSDYLLLLAQATNATDLQLLDGKYIPEETKEKEQRRRGRRRKKEEEEERKKKERKKKEKRNQRSIA